MIVLLGSSSHSESSYSVHGDAKLADAQDKRSYATTWYRSRVMISTAGNNEGGYNIWLRSFGLGGENNSWQVYRHGKNGKEKEETSE